jgi:hypothetical protein
MESHRYGYIGDGCKAMNTLKDEVLLAVMLRRTKLERAADVKLPPLEIVTQFLDLSEHETDFYECIYKQTNSKFNTYVAKGTLMHNYAHIFELLSKLRQAVDHPYLVTCSDSHLQTAVTVEGIFCFPLKYTFTLQLAWCCTILSLKLHGAECMTSMV